MNIPNKQRVVIVGGGTAGWMTAAAMSKQLAKVCDITLIESEEIGSVGVGEATIPTMHVFNSLIGLDEQEFMRETSATFKLGISFENWKDIGDEYFHSFGSIGQESFYADFHHFWLRSQSEGIDSDIGEYCVELQAAKANKFYKGNPNQSNINYAFHLDSSAYAQYLRKLSEANGINRIEGKIVKVLQCPQEGTIQAITLASGEQITGDIFIDCSGFRGLLIEETLHSGFEDWSHHLLCNSAYVMQTASTDKLVPYTRSIAHCAGWRWQIPLQHRVGNGLVYCDKYLNDDQARQLLIDSVQGEGVTEPRLIKFKTGRRRKAWIKNCIAIGLSSGFVEPLESTSIHLISSGIIRLIRAFPFGKITPSAVDEYNEQTQVELEKIRDFIILHYHLTNREDSPFWRYCKNMEIPDTLAHRIDLFAESAQAMQASGELFRVDSWVQVMLGQGIIPQHYHPIVHAMSSQELLQFLTRFRQSVKQTVEGFPDHKHFVERYCQ